MPWRRDRVLVASIGVDDPGTGSVARYLRDAGQEVIVAGDYDADGVDGVVRATVQEDVAAVDLTVSPRDEPHIEQELASGLAAYDADGVLTDLHYRVDDPCRDAWTVLDGVGRTNGQLLADAGLDPDEAAFRDVWDALRDGYIARVGDEEQGERAGRGQAKTIYSANRDRYRDQPTPGQQSILRCWSRQQWR